jgi:hypothetical protein
MSEIKVNKISPRTACGTTTLGDSGDTFTIPSGVTISNLGTASGFGGTGEISWDTTVKTTGTFTATAGIGYFLNTTGGVITVNLPAGTAGASVAMVDYAGTWQTSAVTVSPNGSEKIGGVASDVGLNTEGQSVTFVYIDGTQGWVNVLDSTSNVRGSPYLSATGGTITTSGNDKIHTFTGPGTFTVSVAAVCASNNVVSYMVVAGGGGGGGNDGGGGGGAGGFREDKSPVTPYTASPLDGSGAITVSATSFPITVGAGGTAGAPGGPSGGSGANSIFSTITSAGGGGGGGSPSSATVGVAGGSGGGAGGRSNTSGGSGNTPPVSPSQGSNGGNSAPSGSPPSIDAGGGGGGAGAAAACASNSNGSPGAAGVTTNITGTPTAYSGGGGGGSEAQNTKPGGTGGGGASGNPGVAGTTNTGGGGGGNHCGSGGGAGGSGIVVIRYKFQ